MRMQTSLGRTVLPLLGGPFMDAGEARSIRPCPACAVDAVDGLGCYGARIRMTGNAFRPGDRLLLHGFRNQSTGEENAVRAEVVRCADDLVWLAFDEELPDAFLPMQDLMVSQLLPLCPGI
ncbi:hypothetical protein dsat_0955 [Alkalidesulfovibrio alkalitolerans DSM 16529]|uniref:Uncharacterized protein n=1 Tax=Alkalidesulfovibrio alkalitolerans DSM 16529 TaxID=1121439 RepID=S7T4S4_9BACT|nr:PilZ domain-containing protein [Alkalidesulfovibrio alkalitolerans]EPR31631.1 hypothetical protein dsat_0955 [Alkalidesulfovibrio alkalitolerans DSM 16529]